jgi:hypothetical protein
MARRLATRGVSTGVTSRRVVQGGRPVVAQMESRMEIPIRLRPARSFTPMRIVATTRPFWKHIAMGPHMSPSPMLDERCVLRAQPDLVIPNDLVYGLDRFVHASPPPKGALASTIVTVPSHHPHPVSRRPGPLAGRTTPHRRHPGTRCGSNACGSGADHPDRSVSR